MHETGAVIQVILRHFHSKNVGSEVLWADFVRNRDSCLRVKQIFSCIWLFVPRAHNTYHSLDHQISKTVGATFSPARSGKYLRSARNHKFLIFVMNVLLSASIVKSRALIGLHWSCDPTVIDVPAMQQKFLFMLVWWRVYWSKWTKRRLFTT